MKLLNLFRDIIIHKQKFIIWSLWDNVAFFDLVIYAPTAIVFDRFVALNKFESETISLGKKNTTPKLLKLQKKLNIQVLSSVFLVHKNEAIFLEISRGFMPSSDFETRILLAD